MINYTPHAVTVRDPDSRDHIFPPSGQIARVAMESEVACQLDDGTPTVIVRYGIPLLPAGHPPACIVSTMFADAYRAAHGPGGVSLFVPDSGPSAIRENGQIVAVRALIRR
jgi:hypothetical protein